MVRLLDKVALLRMFPRGDTPGPATSGQSRGYAEMWFHDDELSGGVRSRKVVVVRIKKTKHAAAALREAFLSSQMLRIERRHIDKHPFDGFVVAVGDDWFVMQPVRERVDLDGYEALRFRDVSHLNLSPRSATYGAVLEKKKQVPKRPDLDPTSTESLLLSLSNGWPIVVIHREKEDGGGDFDVGRLIAAGPREYKVRPITPDAELEKPEHYRTSDVTRMTFGNGYESSLAMVARDPRAEKKTQREEAPPVKARPTGKPTGKPKKRGKAKRA